MRTLIGSVTRFVSQDDPEEYAVAMVNTIGESPNMRAVLHLPDGDGGFASPDLDRLLGATFSTERDGTVVITGESEWLRDVVRCESTQTTWKMKVRTCSNC